MASPFGTSPLVTFTRSSKAWAFDSAGLLKEFAVDEARFAYDPVALEIRGLRLGGGATNKHLWSEDLSNTGWSTQAGTTVGTSRSFRGGTMWEINADGSSFTSRIQNTHETGIADGAFCTVFGWFKKGDHGAITIGVMERTNFTLARAVYSWNADGEPVFSQFKNSADVEAIDSGTEEIGDGVWLVWAVIKNVSGGSRAMWSIYGNNDNGNAGSPAFELGNTVFIAERFSGSAYIKTEGSTISVSQDVAQATIGEWLNRDAFTVIFRGRGARGTTRDTAVQSAINTDQGQLLVGMNPSGALRTAAGSASGTILDTDFALALAMGNGEARASKNGGSIFSQSFTFSADNTKFRFGNDGQFPAATKAWWSTIELIQIVPRILADTELQSESTL